MQGNELLMKILLLFNKKEREENIALLIKDAVIAKDSTSEVEIIYWDEQSNNIADIVEYCPDVVVTFPLTIPDLIEEISVIKTICNSVICTFTTEGFAAPKDIECTVGYYNYSPDMVDYYLFFGSKYANIYCDCLRKKGIIKATDCAVVVGYPMWEWKKLFALAKYETINEELLREKQKYSRVVLILSGFAEANKNAKQIKVCNDSYDANAADQEEQIQKVLKNVRCIQDYRNNYYCLIKKLAQRMPNVKFVLKLHPVEIECYLNGEGYDFSEFDKYKNIEIIKKNIPTCFYLRHSDLLLHYGSTVSVEAYLMNVPSVCVEGMYGYVFESDVNVKACEIDRIQGIVEKGLSVCPNEEKNQFCYDFFNYSKEQKYNPSECIADFILTTGLNNNKKRKFCYVDNGYYKKLQNSYLLMACKQFAQIHYEEGCKLMKRSWDIGKIRVMLNKMGKTVL